MESYLHSWVHQVKKMSALWAINLTKRYLAGFCLLNADKWVHEACTMYHFLMGISPNYLCLITDGIRRESHNVSFIYFEK
jgi:hypothetical protein